jgi:hypothetical protein
MTTTAQSVVMKGPSLSDSGFAALHSPDPAITATAEWKMKVLVCPFGRWSTATQVCTNCSMVRTAT